MKTTSIGLLTGAAMLVTAMLMSQAFQAVFPGIRAEYVNESIFRPWSDPVMSLFYVVPFITGIILAWIWRAVRPLFKLDSIFKNGMLFGIIYWTTTLPGMVMSYSSFNVSLDLVTSWTLSGLAESVVAGYCLAVLSPFKSSVSASTRGAGIPS